MHLYIIPRGIKHEVDRFINDLQAQYFPYKAVGKMRKDLERSMGKKLKEGEVLGVQLAVRPIIPYELVFPEESLKEVLSTIWPDEEYPKSANWKIDQLKKIMRKTLGAEKISEEDWDTKGPKRMVYKQNVGIDLIGIRKDNKDGEGNETL